MLELHDIHKSFNRQPILKGISLTLPAGEILCLLGPSGCGKSTLLRMIAGLETPDSGTVRLHEMDITRTPVHQRDFGLMFQDFALFPHMNVAQNVAFGLQMQHVARADIQQRVQAALDLVGLAGFEKRGVSALSGGEQQRVALARSLAPRPRLLMLDEPLGSLDATLRERLVIDLREIIKAAGVTAIYVTHDQQEAFAIADRIAVMNAGQIEQTAPPQTLYLHPETVFVAEFLGLKNVLAGSWSAGIFQTAIGDFPLAQPASHLLLHPAFAEISASENAMPFTVEKVVFRGVTSQVTLRHAAGRQLFIHLPATQQVAVGQLLRVVFQHALPLR